MELIRSGVVVGWALAFTLLVSPAGAQDLSIEQVMTPAQVRATGVAGLSGAQRAELNRWLNEYTIRVLQVATGGGPVPRGTPSTYAGIGSGHWVKKVSNGGRVVELEDGSLWEINAIDRIDTMLWLPITNITVAAARTPIGEYKYTLINKDDGESALAKFLGK